MVGVMACHNVSRIYQDNQRPILISLVEKKQGLDRKTRNTIGWRINKKKVKNLGKKGGRKVAGYLQGEEG